MNARGRNRTGQKTKAETNRPPLCCSSIPSTVDESATSQVLCEFPLQSFVLHLTSHYSLSNLAWKNLRYLGSYTIFNPFTF